jgi:UDP-N-acetylmuramoyl-tripeptide--D-alanyl-D-alanine ligase
MLLRASEVADAVGGSLVGDDVPVDGATHDSREVTPGALFVPVAGARDGHDFIEAARAAGAAAYLTARAPVGGTAVVVADPEAALTDLARWVRGRLPERVVGITGSVGKTSTKDLAAAVLGRRHQTAASLRSFNNELGVPLTLVNAPDGTEALVVEMGMRGHGHIAHLCEIARPTVGVVTAVELVHVELVADLEGVARAKGELIEALPAGGAAVLNADDPLVAAMAERTEARILTFGLSGEVRAERIHLDDDLRASFLLRSPWGDEEVRLGVRGEHQIGNALAAAAVGLLGDVAPIEVAAGLAEASLSPWRMDLRRTPSGAVVLNDAYNAGPASVAAALRSLAHLDAVRRIAVLGEMAELGTHSEAAHRDVGALAERLGIRLIAVDAPAYGGEDVTDIDAAQAALGEVGEGDAVLVKASRVAGLERLATRLLEG